VGKKREKESNSPFFSKNVGVGKKREKESNSPFF